MIGSNCTNITKINLKGEKVSAKRFASGTILYSYSLIPELMN